MIRDKISKQTEKEVISEFIDFYTTKLEKKGRDVFVSMSEIAGKNIEEMNEVLVEAHRKDPKKMECELIDLATTAIFGVMSLRTISAEKTNKGK